MRKIRKAYTKSAAFLFLHQSEIVTHLGSLLDVGPEQLSPTCLIRDGLGSAGRKILLWMRNSNQLQPLQTRMPVAPDDDVVMHLNPQRLGRLDDGFGHLDVGARWRWIA